MLKRLALYCAALLLLALGLIGLLLPFLPGIIFLLGAAVCVSLASPRVAARLHRHPQLARWQRRWHEPWPAMTSLRSSSRHRSGSG